MNKLLSKIKSFKNEALVFFLFLLSRLPSLGNDIFNTDVWKWKQRIYDFGSGVFYLDFAKTIQKYHPGVVLMWIGTIAVKIYNLYYKVFFRGLPQDNNITTVFELHFLQKLLIVFVIGIVLAITFYALRKIFGFRYAILAIIFISLEPFYIALTRVVHLEGLMTTFMLASFVWLYYFLQDTTKNKRLYLSAIFSGLAVLTKSSSLFLVPFSGLILFIHIFSKEKRFVKSVWSSLGIYWKWLVVVVVSFVILWPAMWTVPGQALNTIWRGIFTIGMDRGHLQLFFWQMGK